ncbi:MAG: pyruvate, phosphate dikinase [Candidatus Aenigmarchaeota archaeon]|nr:pyruvate, phosphate dikinase [Candidatus Aenigmarchaeota archaeon]NIP39923.1 pyruvate, phosphate dikinase [Candidatus Aenigmarchaeota archaeon]NIQ17642.1 pyruvate, phosphate dikinase [Candidatus Aenigmarchaeota archaeon]NIS72830.1 pyruvate, phosphate dikinase [Candidatus Aenigmarchaeota archaeon]
MKMVYFFGERGKESRKLLGGKGANLGEMTRIGLPVPPGFTISTRVCMDFIKTKRYPRYLEKQVESNLKKLERKMKRKFGDEKRPLLISVRSGAPVSMPGMMDTVLNLGLNDKTVKGIEKESGDPRFAWDSYRRFIQMFGDVVLEVDHAKFEKILNKRKRGRKDTDLKVEELKIIVSEYKNLVRRETGKEFPSDPKKQLKMSIDAVFSSWDNKRARTYRKLNNIPEDLGTAVNIQAMVFGNLGKDSATGVGFTRDPSTGENTPYGEYLINAQGEDVVAGIRTPKPIFNLKKDLPKAYRKLMKVYKLLDKHYRDMQDLEFTIEKGKLYVLQTRAGKRTAQAAVKIAVDLVKERMISKREAIMRIDPAQLDHLLHKQLDPKEKEKARAIAKGLPASPGASVGIVCFTADRAEELASKGKDVVLVREETSPEDIGGMSVSKGILTARGGMTSHAAVVARGMGICCVAGCEDIIIDEKKKTLTAGEIKIREGEWITLDGGTGEVIEGKIAVVDPEMKGEFRTLMKWVDEFRRLGVRTNADTPEDSKRAKDFGAEGIGLARTEHMFFEGGRIDSVREMILAEDEKGRRNALKKLLPMQMNDFLGIFKEMNGLPVTIRLLDPPLHEFLPKEDKEIRKLARKMKVSYQKLKKKINFLSEFNPMLGFRGCRLGVVYPEISEMQVEAIIKAAIKINRSGGRAFPEIEIPVLGSLEEAKFMREVIERIAKDLIRKSRVNVKYKIGTMIELPRACVVADELAKVLDFFSFGTNDLTQTTYGFSRDDSGKFIPKYIEKGVLKKDPFQVLDREGVGSLMETCVKLGKKTNPKIEIGICGEHGGEPSSVEFCHKLGIDYVSCSPFRVPIARLAAAQAKIKNG